MVKHGSGQRPVHKGVFRFADRLVHRGELPAGRAPPEGRTGFYGQMVCRNVLQVQPDCRVERAAQRVAAESRHPENQVYGDVFEPFALCIPHGLNRLCGIVAAVHQLQTRIVERLDADREAVDARPAQRREVAGRQVVGVGFQGGLLRCGTIEQLSRMFQQPGNGLGRAERRGSAPEIAGADGFAAEVFPPGLQLAVHGGHELLHASQPDAFVEIAVGTDASAKRYVEIESRHSNQRYEKNERIQNRITFGSRITDRLLKGALRPKDKKKIGMSSGPVREFVPPLRPANFGSLFAGVGLRCGSRFRRVSANRDTLL